MLDRYSQMTPRLMSNAAALIRRLLDEGALPVCCCCCKGCQGPPSSLRRSLGPC